MSDKVFYGFPLSTSTQRVRLCQHHKGISFEDKNVDLLKLEHLSSEYLALNPQGQVPTLVVAGQPLYEASIINEFLEELYPERPLMPRDPVLRARIRAFVKYVDSGPTVDIAIPTYRAWVIPVLSALPKEPLLRQVERAPLPVHRNRWLRSVHNEITDDDVDTAYKRVEDFLARMETLLGDGPFLFSTAYTLADVEATPIVIRLQHLGRTDLIAKYRRVEEWLSRVQELPNFAPTYDFLNRNAERS